MIAKNTTVTVNFLVLDTDGFPATGQASNITASISINGATATTISDTITEKGSGWYYFNHIFDTAGNIFITFAASGCVIMPWEDEVAEISAPSASTVASAVWNWTATGVPSPNSIYNKVIGIPVSVWTNGTRSLTSLNIVAGLNTYTLATNSDVSNTQTAIIAAIPSIPNDYAKPGDAMTLTSAYNAAKTASQFNSATDTVNVSSTSVGSIQSGLATASDVSTAQSAIIAAMPSTVGLATSTEVSNAKSDIIAAIPTIPSDYAKPGDTMTLAATDISSIRNGLATGTDVSNAQSAIVASMPDVSALSTFDAANDTVTINLTQAATMVTATGFATPNDIPTDDITAIKNKVNTLENPDLTGIATATNVSDAKDAVIAAIPDDYATSSDLTTIEALVKQLDAGVLHWATTATRLTLYNEDNTVLRVYALERDTDGNIMRISPINA